MNEFTEQREADKAHHEQRIAWLTEPTPKYADGEPVSKRDIYNWTLQSKHCLAIGGMWNSCHCEPRCHLTKTAQEGKAQS